ncbi:MAG: hypothetical protein ABI818_02250 [Acidobacteriota bacterium]
MNETPDRIGADDISRESGLDEPNVPGEPGQDAEPSPPAGGAAPDETGGHAPGRTSPPS